MGEGVLHLYPLFYWKLLIASMVALDNFISSVNRAIEIEGSIDKKMTLAFCSFRFIQFNSIFRSVSVPLIIVTNKWRGDNVFKSKTIIAKATHLFVAHFPTFPIDFLSSIHFHQYSIRMTLMSVKIHFSFIFIQKKSG